MTAFSKELRSFLVVSESDSIRAAANRLNISPPALSRQMQILERSYGAPLLVRTTGGVALTAEGAVLRKEALGWMNADAAMAQKIRRISAGSEAGLQLRLGIMEGLVSPVVPKLMTALEDLHGSVELDLVVGSSAILIEKAEARELDLIVAYNMPRLSRLIVYESFEHNLGVVYAPGLGLEGEGPIQMREALQWPLCLPSSALTMHTRLMAEILSVRVNPTVALKTNSINTIMTFVREGKGISFLPWLDVSQDVEAGRLCFRPIESRRMSETLNIAICRGNGLGDLTGPILERISQVITSVSGS